MMWRDVINLISETIIENDMGDSISAETKKQVFANKKSIRQSEFYQAQATGLKPEMMFEIRYSEYNDEQKIEYNNKTYNVIRAYTKNEEILELICEGIVNNANA
ncbi:phage head closure protein [Fredinandcohnia sp. 179-A 10B2 NHS]|uniref:phage head closure protein n=1 Tax=Fredinandcohnia sp. 179-A 10B2 NHS TaxID=3235176 RepID=UPI0039A03F17